MYGLGIETRLCSGRLMIMLWSHQTNITKHFFRIRTVNLGDGFDFKDTMYTENNMTCGVNAMLNLKLEVQLEFS